MSNVWLKVSEKWVQGRPMLGWMDLMRLQQGDDCGGSATIRERQEGVQSPGAYVDD